MPGSRSRTASTDADGTGRRGRRPTAGRASRPDGPDASDGLDLAALVEAEVLAPGSVPALADLRTGRAAGELTPAQLTARLTRLVQRADSRGAVRRTEAADCRRGMTLRALPDGMALLSITGRAELLQAAFTRIDATARELIAQHHKDRARLAASTEPAGHTAHPGHARGDAGQTAPDPTPTTRSTRPTRLTSP